MWEKIKLWFFYKSFRLEDIKVKKNRPLINAASSIGILFDGTSEENRKIVHKFKKLLNPTGTKSVKSLAFVNNNLPLDNVDYDAFNKKNVKWYGKPFGSKIDAFIQHDFDILIVLADEMLLPYEYITLRSTAGFIIGPDIRNAEKYFDLIVEYPSKNDIDLLIKNIISAVDLIALKSK